MHIMVQTNKTKKIPMVINGETFGQRLSRIRKEKGLTQVQLAEKLGIIQVLISDYERDKLRPYYDTVINFSKVLDVSADELLGLKTHKKTGTQPSLKIARRMKKIESLPDAQQKFVLKTIDSLVKAAEK
jgi:transcriptional regulator with XRE-family HTH domain